MFVDTEIGTAAPRRLHARQVEYMLVAALVAVTVSLFFVMGFFSQASAQPLAETGHNYIQLHNVSLGGEARMAASHMVKAASPIASLIDLPEAATPADRHILFGLMLLAVAVLSTTAFSLFRWQLSAPLRQAHSHG